MNKLDRLGWAEGLALSAFGIRAGVRVNVSGVLPRVLRGQYAGSARRFSRGQGALELLGNSIAVRSQPHQTLKRLQKLVSHTVFIKGTRGEASEAAASILNLSSA